MNETRLREILGRNELVFNDSAELLEGFATLRGELAQWKKVKKFICETSTPAEEGKSWWDVSIERFQRLEKAEIELAAAKERERWISVGEMLPNNENAVLTANTFFGISFGNYYSISGRWTLPNRSGSHDDLVTHWRPLPAPPPEENKHD